MPQRLTSAGRVVIKIGSALLVNQDSGRLRRKWLHALAGNLATMVGRGQEIVLVSSGAIALGARHLGLSLKRQNLQQSQAAAAVGQIRLAHAYEESLARHSITVAQVLVTIADTEERQRHLNARGTIDILLGAGAIPVINENDTVATSEICFGDNDRLAARVAQMVSADCLILLSDVDGLYTSDPQTDPGATFVPTVEAITAEIEAMAGKAKKMGVGSGGMVTKIEAARIATSAGCRMAIISGRALGPLAEFERTGHGTWFMATGASPRNARKQWIGAALNPTGTFTIDEGAVRALGNGGSLLSAGITGIGGAFARGDVVKITNLAGTEIGRGLSAYSDHDARLVMGHNSRDFETLLGYRGGDEIIHRDNMVLRAANKGQARGAGKGRRND